MAISTATYQITARGFTFDRDVRTVAVRQYRFAANVISVPTQRGMDCQWQHYTSSRRGPKLVTETISRQRAATMLAIYREEGCAIERSRVWWEVR